MKIEQVALLKALKTVLPAVPHRTTLPILSTVLLQDGTVTATDLEKFVAVKLPEIGGLDVCVDARLLFDLVQTMSGAIDIVQEGGVLIVNCGNQTSQIKTFPTGEFPVPSLPHNMEAKPLPATFKTDLAKVIIAAAIDEARPILTGVWLGNNGGLAAADGFRLAMTGEFSGQGVIIPAKSLQAVLSLDAVTKYVSDGTQVQFFGTVALGKMALDANVVTQTIVGNFPDVASIMPKAFATTMTFNASDALRALKTVMVLSDDTDIVHFAPAQDIVGDVINGITLVTTNESGNAEATFVTTFGSEPAFEPFALNGKLFQDALSALGKVTMGINAPSQPVLLTEGEYRHIIMPMHVRSK